MSEVTTIQVSKELLKELKSIKAYSRQSYSEVLLDLVKTFKKAKRHSEYDEFLFRIQQEKMKELWDNKSDAVWIMFEPGEIILSHFPFVDSTELKVRPAVVLFEEFGNIVVAGITSNLKMKGISVTQKEGLPVDSVIKTNYVFTISEKAVKKRLMTLSAAKKKILHETLLAQLRPLVED